MDVRKNFVSPIGKLRVVGFVEGLSFIALVFLGMPLKYMADMPIFVKVLGPLHGVLFVWLCYEIAQAVFGHDWPKRCGLVVFVAALFPLGPFLIDGWLKKQQAQFHGGVVDGVRKV